MIPQIVLRKFLARKLKDYRTYQKLSPTEIQIKCDRLPARPPIWKKLRHDQKVCFIAGAETGRFFIMNDTGCIAGETEIETEFGPKRVDELEKLGQCLKVLSNTDAGLRFVPASAPIKYPSTELYEVKFASGRKIVVTARHLFWTFRGWVSCADLLLDERLPIFDACHPQPNSELDRKSCLEDVPHWNYKVPNYQSHCCSGYHPYDALLLSESNNGQVFSPSQVDVLGHGYDYLQMGVLASKLERIHLYRQYDHLSTNHSSRLDYLDSNCMECQVFESDPKLFVGNTRISSQASKDANLALQAPSNSASECFLVLTTMDANPNCIEQHTYEQLGQNNQISQLSSHKSSVDSPIFEVYQHPIFSQQASNPPIVDTILSVTYLKKDVYYDLHVPIWENYIAHGLCHHNTGKSVLSIALILYFAKLKQNKRVLVLVPNLINKSEWAREIVKHSPNTDYLILKGSTKEKWEALESTNALIVIETYVGMMRMVCDVVPHPKKDKQKWQISQSLIKRLMKYIDGLVLDESTSAKSKAKLPYRVCRQISKRVNLVFALSGTPFGRDPIDIWAQMYLVDEGETLGATLGLFREAFFHGKENYWGGTDWTIDKRKMPLLHDMLANRSIRYTADASDLPKLVSITKYVSLPKDAKTYYLRARDKLIKLRGNYREAHNEFLRMRQISSGFLGYYDDDQGTKAEIEFTSNPKLDLLLSIIESIPRDRKILVFHDFVFSGSIISRELDAAGIGHVRLHKTKNQDELLHKFDHDKNIQVFVLNTAGAFGLNLQIARYGIFFESPLPVIMRKQMIRRFERQYSLHKKVFLYDLVVRNTVDEQILAFHKEGKELFTAIIEGNAEI
jgi:superfamily II DNA or RNA helicase